MINNRINTLNKLTLIFQDVFNDFDLMISENTSAKDIEEWDSLAQINLILAIEKVFKLRFNPNEIESLQNIGDMIDLIIKKN